MADRNDKVAGNVEGEYYVDTNCIACGLCINEASSCFVFNDGEELAFVYKQPDNDSEIASCENALEQCPVEAIGNDGKLFS